MPSNLPAVPGPNTPITAAQVESMEAQVIEALPFIDSMNALQEWRLRAKALETYLRSKELQRPMLGAQRRVEARIGELLGEPEPGRPWKNNPPREEGYSAVPRDGDRRDFRILAMALTNTVLEEPEEWRKSRRALVSLLRYRLGLLPVAPSIPEGQFRVIVADPPWQLTTGPEVFHGTGEQGNVPLDYTTMPVEEIRAMPVAERAAPDSHLYLWTTNRYIEAAYDIARAWGFKPSVLLVWAKTPRGVGLGGAYRLTTEFVVYARRGTLAEMQITNTTWFNWPRGRHSQKPDEFYKMVESMTPAPDGALDRLELFSRAERDGWTAWGDEVGVPSG